MSQGFTIVDNTSTKNNMNFDRKVIFYEDRTGKIEAEYYYLKGMCNYLLSWGFTKDSLGELRKSKANKTKKPFFSLQKGWFGENEI